jgi:uncharacterized protein
MRAEADGSLDGKAATTLRVGAVGDIHCRLSARDQTLAAFAALSGKVDLLLVAGDLTMHGDPDEAAIFAEASKALAVPTFAVLGNHDWHGGHHDELVAAVETGGVTVLERGWSTCDVRGIEVGVVGTKGFVGGFPGSHLPDFGEPLLREVYAHTTAEVEALHEGLCEVAVCPIRLVLLHYSPTGMTLEGEPPGIWAFLGTDRLAAPILEHAPDLVVHGHAHAGRFEGSIGEVPVFNVSVPVIGRDFWIFELSTAAGTPSPIH